MSSLRRLAWVWVALVGCSFQPDLSRYPACGDGGACAAGSTCLTEAAVCVPDCITEACAATPGRDGGFDGGSDGGSISHPAGGSGGEAPDAGDAGAVDASVDAGPPDAGSADGGSADAGVHDAGPVDAGTDAGPTLVVHAPSLLQDGLVGTPYVWLFDVTGGVAPLGVTRVDGGLPTGLTLAATPARLLGTPTQAGRYEFTLLFTDSAVVRAMIVRTLTIDVLEDDGGLKILTREFVDGTVGAPYSMRLIAGGAPAPYAWTVLAESDAGLALTDATDAGRYAGTPTSPGLHSVTVEVSASTGARVSRTFPYTVR